MGRRNAAQKKAQLSSLELHQTWLIAAHIWRASAAKAWLIAAHEWLVVQRVAPNVAHSSTHLACICGFYFLGLRSLYRVALDNVAR